MTTCTRIVTLIAATALILAGGCNSLQPAEAPPSQPPATDPPDSYDGPGLVSDPEPVDDADEPELVDEPTDTTGEPPDDQWATYEGAWFEVEYPSDFSVREQDESASADGYDSVLFVSPDEEVHLFVFSPQWFGGDVGWIDMTPDEEIIDSQTEDHGGLEATIVTVRQIDGAYERIYEDAADLDLNTRLVFGYRYPDEMTRDGYTEVYEQFKASLIQYAD